MFETVVQLMSYMFLTIYSMCFCASFDCILTAKQIIVVISHYLLFAYNYYQLLWIVAVIYFKIPTMFCSSTINIFRDFTYLFTNINRVD